MTSDILKFHLQKLKAATVDAYDLEGLADWIVDHTRLLDGSRYSYVGREYQRRIASDTSQEIVIRKCAQVGLSEITARRALAMCAVLQPFNCIITHPSASAAADFMRDRVNPVIAASPALKAMVNNTVDNVGAKQIGLSFLYLKGCASDGAPLSVPSDIVIFDEVDASSQETMKLYQSRLTNSKYRMKIFLSTPTSPGFGIDKEFSTSRRHFNFVKCSHCNHYYIPDYFAHVRVPGYTGELRDLNNRNLHKYKWREAYLICPRCELIPDLSVEFREWVCENPTEAYIASGYQVSPFDAPGAIQPPYLVQASTSYGNYGHFINQNLGLPSSETGEGITEDDLDAAIVSRGELGAASYVMGVDLGMTCWITILAVRPQGLTVAHVEAVKAEHVVQRQRELASRWRTRMTLCDMFPYTETVMRMQDNDRLMYAAYYTRLSNLELFQVRQREEEEDKGLSRLRQIGLNRDVALDHLMEDLKSGYLTKLTDDYDETWKAHLQDMKRVMETNKSGEGRYTWKKSSSHAEDHLHHSLLYAWAAAKLIGLTGSVIGMPQLMTKFKVKSTA
jgi:hypothetical protein